MNTATITAPSARPAQLITDRRGSDLYDATLLRLRPEIVRADGTGYALGLMGLSPGGGTSTTAANLAIRAADLRLGPVVLVECSGQTNRLFKKAQAGFAEALAGSIPWGRAVQATEVGDLHTIPGGDPALLRKACFDIERLQEMIKQLRAEYRVVIVDLPPASSQSESLVLSQCLDGVLAVVRSQHVKRDEAQAKVEQLKSDGVNMVGAILSRQKSYLPKWIDRRI